METLLLLLALKVRHPDRVMTMLSCTPPFLRLPLALKVRYPDRFALERGNHESRQITQVRGRCEYLSVCVCVCVCLERRLEP